MALTLRAPDALRTLSTMNDGLQLGVHQWQELPASTLRMQRDASLWNRKYNCRIRLWRNRLQVQNSAVPILACCDKERRSILNSLLPRLRPDCQTVPHSLSGCRPARDDSEVASGNPRGPFANRALVRKQADDTEDVRFRCSSGFSAELEKRLRPEKFKKGIATDAPTRRFSAP